MFSHFSWSHVKWNGCYGILLLRHQDDVYVKLVILPSSVRWRHGISHFHYDACICLRVSF
jgi:hypothetical protein